MGDVRDEECKEWGRLRNGELKGMNINRNGRDFGYQKCREWGYFRNGVL